MNIQRTKHIRTAITTLLLASLISLLSACATPVRELVIDDKIQVEVIAQGRGPLILMLPSAARSAEDFAQVAQRIADAGFRVLSVEPRGSGRTAGAYQGVTLNELAQDIAAVIRQQKSGPAILVGHAAGSFVARRVAVDFPQLVRGVVLAGAGARKYPLELNEAVQKVHDEHLSDVERMRYLRFGFFSPASDASVWLTGWRPLIQFGTGGPPSAASRNEWWGAGDKPVLEIQGRDDPFKPPSAAQEFKAEFGDRVSVVVIDNASHALIPEQPQAVAKAIIDWAKALPAAG